MAFTFPHSFVAGTKAKAEDVNANFTAAEEEINETLVPGLAAVGDLKATAAAAAPTGWLLCDGSAVSRTTYADLFAATGTAFGAGDGATTFNVPNLAGKMPLGVSGSHAGGTSGGEETHTLSAAEMPRHQHTGTTNNENTTHQHERPAAIFSDARHEGTGFSYTTIDAGGNAKTGNEITYHTHSYATSFQGDSGSHNNMPPSQAVNWVVKH